MTHQLYQLYLHLNLYSSHTTELGPNTASDRFVVQSLFHKRFGRHTAQFAVWWCKVFWLVVFVGCRRCRFSSSRSGQTAESRAAHQVSADAAGARPYAERHVQATPVAIHRRGLESAHLRRNELAPATAECRRSGRPNATAACVRQERLSTGTWNDCCLYCAE